MRNCADRKLCTEPESLRFDEEAAQRAPATIVAHEPETEIGRRHAGRAAARARIAHEISHVGTVAALDDAHAAMHRARHRLAARIECVAREAGIGPFPDVSGDIDKPVLICAERADGLRLLIDVVVPITSIDR
jgi:hypothetical protein